jgi:serine/threonine-protein kinase
MDATASLNQALAGRYEVEREVGQGGMATVYVARDIRHNRRVALKVLHPDLAAALGAERFLAEITTTANLQHPHILPLHDSGDADGNLFYVMPYVEGETLRARLQREQLLPVEDAVRVAREVLSALDYAHRHGVVHRDIKPENVLLHDGSALVADFGISLAVSAASGPRMTQTGLSLGTPSYMSPEQAMGERVIDGRADIYATGATLYEMLIGEPPFTGPTSQAVVARLLTEEPRSLIAQRKMIPPNVDAAVRKALQKLPADRFASAAEMSSAIARTEFTIDVGTTTIPPAAVKQARWRRVGILIGVAVAASAAGAFVGAKLLASRPAFEPRTRFSFDAPTNGVAASAGIAISPDGSRIVYALSDSTGLWSLALRSLDNETPTVLAGTKMAARPVFSPDGRQIVFVQDGKLRRMSLDGGAVTTIMTVGALANAAWVSDDVIFLFGRNMQRVSPNGGTVDTISTDSTRGPSAGVAILPGAQAAIIAEGRGQAMPELFFYSIVDRKVTPLGLVGGGPTYVDGGYLLYVDLTGTLFSVRIDPKDGKLLGKPVALVGGVRLYQFRAMYAVSRFGTIVFAKGADGTGQNQLVTVDRTGRPTTLPLPVNAYRSPRYSPDGRRLAMTISRGDGTNNGDVWTYDFASQRMNRLTFDGSSISPGWTADGRTITFTHREAATRISAYNVAADGSGTAQLYFQSPAGLPYEATYTTDGKKIVFRVDAAAARGARDILIASVDSPQVARPLLASPFQEHEIALSPDNKWLAYVSDASGRSEVYLKRIDGVSGVWPVSRNGGKDPRWGGSMRELLFRNNDTLFSVSLELGAEARPGQPRALFAEKYLAGPWDTLWDVSPDGKQFVFIRELVAQAPDRMTVLTHWLDRVR